MLTPPDFNVEFFATECLAIGAGLDVVGLLAVDPDATKTLTTAVVAAGLVETLSEPNGPYTVFAPSEAAFGALPDGLVECLLREESKEVLTSILTYHVLDGSVRSDDLSDGMTATTIQGEDVTITISGQTLSVNQAEVISENFLVTNGVVHTIGAVLLPPSIDVDAFMATCSKSSGAAAFNGITAGAALAAFAVMVL